VQKGSGEVVVESIVPAGAPVMVAAQPLPPVGAATVPAAIPVAQEPGGYVVQLGAFGNYANAQAFVTHTANQIAPLGVEASVHEAGGLFRVVVGPYPTRDEASRTGERLRTALGIDNMVRPQ
jgi:cell division septation protein DedD